MVNSSPIKSLFFILLFPFFVHAISTTEIKDTYSFLDSVALKIFCSANYLFGANTQNCFSESFSISDIENLIEEEIANKIPLFEIPSNSQNLVTIVEKILQPQYISTPGPRGEKGDQGASGVTTIVNQQVQQQTSNLQAFGGISQPFWNGSGSYGSSGGGGTGPAGPVGPTGPAGAPGTTTIVFSGTATSTGDIVATGTITTLNFNFTNATGTNATTTNFYTNNLDFNSASGTSVSFVNATTTNSTSTNSFVTNLTTVNATTTNLFSTLANFTSLFFGNATATNLFLNNNLVVNGTTTLATTTFSVLPTIPLALGNILVGNPSNIATPTLPGANGTILSIVAGVPTWVGTSTIGSRYDVLTGFATTTGIVTSADTILTALGKLQGNIELITASSSGISSLNGQTGFIQDFATSASGTDFSISSGANIHTFNLPSASALNRGALTSIDWTTFNNKLSTATGTSGQIARTGDGQNPMFSLVNTGVNTGTYGSSTTIPVLTIDAQGRITSATTSIFNSGSATPAGSSSQIQFNNGGLFGATSTFVWDNTNGRLGIGTTSPMSVFAINSRRPIFTMRDNFTAQTYQMRVGGPVLGNTDFDIFNLTSNTTAFKIQADGNIAIGTSTIPANNSRLFVYGGGNGANIDVRGTSAQDQSVIELEGSDYDTVPNSVKLQYYGPNGLGTTAGFNNQRLGVLAFGGATTALIGNQNASPLIFFTDNAEKMRLGATGNLTIGTTTETERLSVLGNVRFSGALMPNGLSGATGTLLMSQGASLAPVWVATSTLGVGGGGYESGRI